MPERKIKLLIVDDEKDICSFEKGYFEKHNLSTFTAQNGTAAIALAKKINPDIAIVDIHMSKGISGIEILKQLLKAAPKCKNIMVTWDKEKALEAKKLGAVDFVIKPTELKVLENSVNKAIRSLSENRGKE